MTPHRYRCETCNKFHIERLQREEIIEDAIAKVWVNQPMCGDEWLLPDHISMSSHYGFCCHSDAVAAEQRIKDVIKELETRIYNIERARKENSQLTGGHLTVQLYKDTISLLRNGVEKK